MKYLLYHNAIKKTYGVKNKIQYNTIVNFVKTKLQHSTLTSRSFIRCFFINNLNCWTLGARRGEGCTYKGKSGKSCTAEAFKPCLFKTKTTHFSTLFKRGVTIFCP